MSINSIEKENIDSDTYNITLRVGEFSSPVIDLLENVLKNRSFDYRYRFVEAESEVITVSGLRLSNDCLRPVRVETRRFGKDFINVLCFYIDGEADDIQIPETKWDGLDIEIKQGMITITNEDGDWNQFVVCK